ncbi:hypothetical protein FHS01_002055 [Longimicrobium terrae]|uniref:Helicase/UvrB N-terminal domain-containing protein n=1 Tax=Longimicrobium terrae TaxID=1639882 RepID=A0A841GX86_9BACT|nr:hypothetical protein [Longimicrobium terrae]MBB6070435.1 hypothetical protein [Longimicrobium terrae]
MCTEIAGSYLDRAYQGAALTYQQVVAEPSRYRRSLGGGFAVLDECHHMGEGKSWADALNEAFGGASHRLSLSGTAFRSDGCRIPFVRYDENGVSIADYRYGYAEALRDCVVRPVYFVSFGGETIWYRGGRKMQAEFGQALSREDAAARLRTALDPAGGWMAHVLRRAHQRLTSIRHHGHDDAGGLVVCMDQTHARRVAELLRRLTGSTPAMALSDDPHASAVIAEYAGGRKEWIVAVRQVSEGTDIPRLRVGLWATNTTTELFFRQVVGRLVRVVPGLLEQDAYLYLPADPQLLRHARSLAEERSHSIPGPQGEENDLPRVPAAPTTEPDFRALGSTAGEGEVVAGSHVIAPAELTRAVQIAGSCGLALTDPLPFALALREAAHGGATCDLPVEAIRRGLRSFLSRRVREFCARSGSSHKEAYARLKRQTGKPVSRLNEAALCRHVQTVNGWIERHCGSASEPEQTANSA